MRRPALIFAALLPIVASPPAASAAPLSDDAVAALSRIIFFGPVARRDEALDALVDRGDLDVAATLILAVRYRGRDASILRALRTLTGAEIDDWREAMLWQEARPEIVPHPSFVDIKRDVFDDIDLNFDRFLGDGRAAPDRLSIRLEEIVWGGAYVDGIPPLDQPTMIAAAAADYLRDDDLVFGVEIGGDARAYPLRILGWHEMLNDVVGGVPVALAYCPLCGSGVLYETQLEGRADPLLFGSSGLLYRSNKLMFDRQTDSLWSQLTGEPVSGPMRDAGVRLMRRPMAVGRWADWRTKHPETTVLALDTGFTRNYGSGVVYRDYFASDALLYPARSAAGNAAADAPRPKDYVFGLVDFGAAKAWPLAAFAGGRVINDVFAGRPIVLVGEAEGRTVRAYERGDQAFSAGETSDALTTSSGVWRLHEAFLEGPDGARTPRLPGRVAYWFAWNNHLNFDADLYRAPTSPDGSASSD